MEDCVFVSDGPIHARVQNLTGSSDCQTVSKPSQALQTPRRHSLSQSLQSLSLFSLEQELQGRRHSQYLSSTKSSEVFCCARHAMREELNGDSSFLLKTALPVQANISLHETLHRADTARKLCRNALHCRIPRRWSGHGEKQKNCSETARQASLLETNRSRAWTATSRNTTGFDWLCMCASHGGGQGWA
jgi:hypothetical protein